MLDQIRSFLTVVEEGSLHRAAARLHISQSALSRQMQALEHELGGRLLERSATGVTATAGGHALAKRMGAVLASYDLAMSDTRRAIYSLALPFFRCFSNLSLIWSLSAGFKRSASFITL